MLYLRISVWVVLLLSVVTVNSAPFDGGHHQWAQPVPLPLPPPEVLRAAITRVRAAAHRDPAARRLLRDLHTLSQLAAPRPRPRRPYPRHYPTRSRPPPGTPWSRPCPCRCPCCYSERSSRSLCSTHTIFHVPTRVHTVHHHHVKKVPVYVHQHKHTHHHHHDIPEHDRFVDAIDDELGGEEYDEDLHAWHSRHDDHDEDLAPYGHGDSFENDFDDDDSHHF